jgi:hypothetical protein
MGRGFSSEKSSPRFFGAASSNTLLRISNSTNGKERDVIIEDMLRKLPSALKEGLSLIITP